MTAWAMKPPMLRHLTRIPGVRRWWSKVPIGSPELRTEHDIWSRPAYAYGIHAAATLAKQLGLPRISVLELGVAGGNGLVAMEEIAGEISRHIGVEICVIGCDGGAGMPPPRDYRDLPHVWREGFYSMDVDKLRKRLRRAELVLGPIGETLPALVKRRDLPPIGFVAFDLDYYSSTRDAFALFDGAAATHLPRVFCYFDDVVWPERACHNEFTGELCAIREFNDENATRKIAKLANLSWMRAHPAPWNEQIYVFHDFDHPQYGQLITQDGAEHRQRPLAR
jgi:hypothetical protein